MSDDLAFKPEDDRYHPLSDDPYETETNWWSFNIPERQIGCWPHAPYYPNRKSVTLRIFAWDDEGYDPARMAYYRKVDEAPMLDAHDLTDILFHGHTPGGSYPLNMIAPGLKYNHELDDPDRNLPPLFPSKAHLPP